MRHTSKHHLFSEYPYFGNIYIMHLTFLWLQPFMNHLSAHNSLKLNLRSICVSCCKIDSKLNCFSFYKDEITLIYGLNLCSCCIWIIFVWWGHRDPKYCQRTRSMIHTSATEVNQTLIIWSYWHTTSFLYTIYLFPQYWSLWL